MKKQKLVFKILRQKKGAALMAVMGIVSILIVMMQGMSVSSQTEYVRARNKFSELSARYNSRSAAEISLLRLLIYQEGVKSVSAHKEIAKIIVPYLNLTWSLPFVWPVPVLEDSLKSDKDNIEEINKRSFLKGSYSAKIVSEDGKLDINDLSSSLEHIRKFTFDSLFRLISQAVESNKNLQEKFESEDIIKLINNISDWTDLDNRSKNGGDEDNVEDGARSLNRSFVYIEEIKKVPGMTEDLYQAIQNYITAYGVKGVNINQTSQQVLMALGLPEIIAEEVAGRTNMSSDTYAPFSSLESFCSYLNERSSPLCKNLDIEYRTQEMLKFNTPLHFHVEAVGQFRKLMSQTEFVAYNHRLALKAYKKTALEQEKIDNNEQDKSDNSEANKKEASVKKSEETSLNLRDTENFPLSIMYWKENL